MRGLLRSLTVLLAVLAAVTGCTEDTDWVRSGPPVTVEGHGGSPEATETTEPTEAAEPAVDVVLGQLASLVDDTASADEVPGVIVGVRWSDGTEWIHAAGVENLATGAAIDPAAQWPARSITKSFTVTALLRLVEAGVVSLDETIDQYVDGVPGGDRVTLEELALMTSGLPDYTNERFIDVFLEDPGRVFEDDELLAFIEGEPLEAEPGSEHRYINANTLVLGMALAEATGSTVGDVLDGVVGPLGLGATRYRPDPGEVDAPTGYQPDDDGLDEVPLLFGVFGAAGAMVTDLDDLLAWGEQLGRGAGLPADLAALRTDLATPLLEGPEYDSYGLGLGELEGWWGHTGEGFGYTALVMHDATSGATVVIFSNVSNLDEGHVPTNLFRRMVPLLESVT